MTKAARILLVFIFSWQFAMAQSVKRFGVVDLESDSISASERAQLLSLARSRFGKTGSFAVVREEEVEAALTEKNRLGPQYERTLAEHRNKDSELRNQIATAEKYYLASQFDEAIVVLESVLQGLKGASLVLQTDLPVKTLELLAACYFFNGKEAAAKRYLSALLDLDSSVVLSAQKYPPPLLDIFNSARREKRYEWKVQSFVSDQKGLRANFLGKTLEVAEGERVVIRVPVDHPILGQQIVVFEKEGYFPVFVSLRTSAAKIEFESLENTRLQTKGLFAPIGAYTPPPELKAILQRLSVQVVFLCAISRIQDGRWRVRGQLLEQPSARVSPIVERESLATETAFSDVMDELLKFVSKEGSVFTEQTAKFHSEPSVSSSKVEENGFSFSSSGKPFYKTWWFWTLAGVGLAGAGVGGYFLLKPEDSLKLNVVGSGS